MAANKIVRFGPILLTTTLTTNLLNPPTLTGGVVAGTSNAAVYFLLRHLRIVNVLVGGITASLWVGATGAVVVGTEIIPSLQAIAGKSALDIYFSPALRLDTGDFLVGGASSASAGVLTIDGEIGIA